MISNIFVCYHKPTFVVKSDVIISLQVGKALSKCDLGLKTDDTGINISSKNPYYCELTATYWIWKNIQADVVGLFHYRRFINFKNDRKKVHHITSTFLSDYKITKDNIESILKEYDLILPKKSKPCKKSLYDFYNHDHIKSDMDLMIEILTKKYPQHIRKIENELKCNSQGYFANMLIAKKEVFDMYAEWLFDILFDIEKLIQNDVIKRNTYQQRVYGFLAERLMSVFVICHPQLKIKEFPMIYVEEGKIKWVKYQFQYYKRKILQLLKFKGTK